MDTYLDWYIWIHIWIDIFGYIFGLIYLDIYSDWYIWIYQFGLIYLDIYLNDPSITEENMYRKEFDPHYLIDRHIKQYLPYINIDKVAIDFIVWGPEGDIIYSWNN